MWPRSKASGESANALKCALKTRPRRKPILMVFARQRGEEAHPSPAGRETQFKVHSGKFCVGRVVFLKKPSDNRAVPLRGSEVPRVRL